MPMSHYMMVPITAQGIITDSNIATILPEAMREPFQFSDIFLYSHGWWTNAEAAMVDYYRFSIGLAAIVLGHAEGPSRPESSLGIGVHWPAMISEDSRSIVSILEPLTYYNRKEMADDVGEHGGYSLLRLALEGRQKVGGTALPRVHLLGHSFGCRVVCSALQHLVTDPVTRDLIRQTTLNLVLLQAAFDFDDLAPGGLYKDVLSLPNLRVLTTRSQKDIALQERYEQAQRIARLFKAPVPALGADGPSPSTIEAVGATRTSSLAIDTGLDPAALPADVRDRLAHSRMIIADLTPLHEHDTTYQADPFSGYHSDIFLPEIYRLIAAFLFAGTGAGAVA